MKRIYKVKFLLLDITTNKLLYLESHELHSYELHNIGGYSIKLQEQMLSKYKNAYVAIKIK